MRNAGKPTLIGRLSSQLGVCMCCSDWNGRKLLIKRQRLIVNKHVAPNWLAEWAPREAWRFGLPEGLDPQSEAISLEEVELQCELFESLI